MDIEEKRRQDWLKARQSGIGSSDIEAILGGSKWSSPLDIYRSKIGDTFSPDTPDTLRGKALEGIIADMFGEKENKTIIVPENIIYTHKKVDYFKASIDRFYLETTSNHRKILECKAPRNLPLDLPISYQIQTQWAMNVLGINECAIAIHDFNKWDVSVHYCIANKELIEILHEAAHGFWNTYVIPRIPPPPINDADVRYLYPKAMTGKIFEVNNYTFELYEKLIESRNNKKEAETQFDIYKGQFEALMSDSDVAIYNGVPLVTFKNNKDGVTFDEKRFKQEQPELYQKYLIEKQGARVFRIKE